MFFYAISSLLFLLYAGLIIFYRQSWVSEQEYNVTRATNNEARPFISVIVVARNEEKYIASCISSILSQTYNSNFYEIIFVDDHSSDETVSIVNTFRHENIRIISMADFTAANSINSYKKAGLEKAISVARGSLIVTTDADCIAGKKWLETIATFHLENDFVFIAAPVVIDGGSKVNHDFLSIFQALDFMTMQGITGASVAKKFHNMCNGANLAYTKQAFDIAGGFKGIDNIASGDDMLLMQKIQKLYPQKIGFLKSKDAIVVTQPAVSLLEFMNQRIRWASKSGSYKDPKITSVLFLVYLFNAWIFMSMILSIFFIHFSQAVLLLFAGKILVEIFFLYPVSKFFGKRQLLWWFIPAEPFHILYIILAGWLGRFGSYKWKGRRVK